MIYFDVDGVVRDLVRPHGLQDNKDWDCFGEEQLKLIDSDPIKYLVDCPPHQSIVDAINLLNQPITFITNQCRVPARESATIMFLAKHITGVPYEVIFVGHAKEKLAYLKKGDVLFDDYPRYHEEAPEEMKTKNVMLVRRPWNEHLMNMKKGKVNFILSDYYPEATVVKYYRKGIYIFHTSLKGFVRKLV
jgi:hypothetical protein